METTKPISVFCYAVGRVCAKLDVDKQELILPDTVFNVSYNRSFSTWLKFIDADMKKQLKEKEHTFSVLPKTYQEEPYLSYELIGVDSRLVEKENLFVCGQVIFHNNVSNFVLVRVYKHVDKSFVLKLEVEPQTITKAAYITQDVNLNSLTGCYLQFYLNREGRTLKTYSAKLLATLDSKVELKFQQDYVTGVGRLLDYDLKRDYVRVEFLPDGQQSGFVTMDLHYFSRYLKYSKPFCEEIKSLPKEKILSKYDGTLFKIKARQVDGRYYVKMIRPLEE